MIDINYTWEGEVTTVYPEGSYKYAPPKIEVNHSIDTLPTSYILNWEWPEDEADVVRYRYGIVTTTFSVSVEDEEEDSTTEAKSKADEIATAISHSQKSNIPFNVKNNSTGEVIYRSDKTELKLDENERCPICYSQIKKQDGDGTQTWVNDPIRTPNGLAGVRFQGFQQIALSDIADIQERNIGLGMKGEKFEPYDKGKRQIQLADIIDLRTGTEELINNAGMTIEEYFNYDELGRATRTSQTDWIDSNLTANTFNLRALHIEDLRHYIRIFGNIVELYYDTSVQSIFREFITADEALQETNSTVVNNAPSVFNLKGNTTISRSYYLLLDRYNYQILLYDKSTKVYTNSITIPEMLFTNINVIVEGDEEKIILYGRTPESDVESGEVKIYKIDMEGTIEAQLDIPYEDNPSFTKVEEIELPIFDSNVVCDSQYMYVLYEKQYIIEYEGAFYRGKTFLMDLGVSPEVEWVWYASGVPNELGQWTGWIGSDPPILTTVPSITAVGPLGEGYLWFIPDPCTVTEAGGWEPITRPYGGMTINTGETVWPYYPAKAPQLVLKKIALSDLTVSSSVDLLSTRTTQKNDILTSLGDTHTTPLISTTPYQTARSNLILEIDDNYLYLASAEGVFLEDTLQFEQINASVYTFDLNGRFVARNKVAGNETIVRKKSEYFTVEPDEEKVDEEGKFNTGHFEQVNGCFSISAMSVRSNQLLLQYSFYIGRIDQKNFNYDTIYNQDDYTLYTDADMCDKISSIFIPYSSSAEYQNIKITSQKYKVSSYFHISNEGYISDSLIDIPIPLTYDWSVNRETINYGNSWAEPDINWI